MPLPFTKMQALGNDVIIIDDLGKRSTTFHTDTPEYARQLCDRRFGIGADQILWLRDAHDKTCDARMEVLNSDGSTAEMCGNGVRSVGVYLHRYGLKPNQFSYKIETLAGIKTVEMRENGIAVDMGIPEISTQDETLEVLGNTYTYRYVNMGNPHVVVMVPKVDAIDLNQVGSAIEHHPKFPNRTNVEFVEVTGPSSVKARIWERGAGATLACGTGACAAVVVPLLKKLVTGPTVTIALPGGELKVHWNGPGQEVIKEGQAQEVFKGEYLG
jgi:diaminopimelate epimerase